MSESFFSPFSGLWHVNIQTLCQRGWSRGWRGSRSRFTENKLVLSQFTGNKIGISRFTRKIAFFDTNLRNLRYLKSYGQSTALLDVFIIRPLLVLGAEFRARTLRGIIVLTRSRNIVNYGLKIIEDTTRTTVHDELNISFLFHGELFRKSRVYGF